MLIVELDSFVKSAKKILNKEQINDLKTFLTNSPEIGDIISGAGGLRKVRWKLNNNKGKSGGSRVIYYFCNDDIPLFLVFCYSKSEQENLTKEQKNFFKKLMKILLKNYQGAIYE